jgi:Secretion system C-terminal sorting domain
LFRALCTSNKEHGAFITPTDWSILAGDVVNMISDGSIAGLTQIFRWNNIFGTNPTLNPFTDALLAGYKITFIKVSPNDNNRVYIGLSDRSTNDIRIVKVESINIAPSFTNFTGTFTGASSVKGYISCIAIKKSSTGATDDDDIVFTLSNYGVQSVWKKDFNAVINPNWSPLDLLSGGSLPDMPIRGAAFPPTVNPFGHQLLLATETGVWATDHLNGTSTLWVPINNNKLPKVRTQALICRETDGMLFAATHGRGLWRSDVYTSSRVDFNANITVTDIWIPVIMGGRVKYISKKSCTLNLTDISTSVVPVTSISWHVNDIRVGSSSTVSVPYCGEQDIRLTINGVGMVKRLQEFINIPTVCPSCATFEPIEQPVGFNKKVSEEESMGDLMVYPNPNQGVFNIQMEPDWGKIEQMEVYNSTGKLIQTSELASGEINIEQEPTGVYICRVKTSNGKVLIGKVLKQ